MRPQSPYPSDEDTSAGPAWAGLLPGQPTVIDEATTEVPVIGPVAGTAEVDVAPAVDDDAEGAVTVEQTMPAQDGPEPARTEPARTEPARTEAAAPPGAGSAGDAVASAPNGARASMAGGAAAAATADVTVSQPAPVPRAPAEPAQEHPAGGAGEPTVAGDEAATAVPEPADADADPSNAGISPFGLPPGASAATLPDLRPTPVPQPVPGTFHPHPQARAPKPSPAPTPAPVIGQTPPSQPAAAAPPVSPAPLSPASALATEQRPGDVASDPIAIWSEEAARLVRDRWQHLQVQFIDDPDAAVRGAKNLVTEAVRTLSDRLLAEPDEFDPHRDTDHPGTEAMRVAMRRYREFLDRVLAL